MKDYQSISQWIELWKWILNGHFGSFPGMIVSIVNSNVRASGRMAIHLASDCKPKKPKDLTFLLNFLFSIDLHIFERHQKNQITSNYYVNDEYMFHYKFYCRKIWIVFTTSSWYLHASVYQIIHNLWTSRSLVSTNALFLYFHSCFFLTWMQFAVLDSNNVLNLE